MQRRSFLASTAAGLTAGLAAPRIAAGQNANVLRFIPQADLALLDPVHSPSFVTSHHAMLVFDTLYGVDESLKPRPQMVEGHQVEKDGREWTLRLRDGLRFHDGTAVLARDCVASIERWGKRDSFGLALMAATDEVSAPDDRSIRFRLKRPFPLLPDALGNAGATLAVIMPERLARTDPFRPVPEIVGSGPYRFLAGDRVPGSLAAYARFADYEPRSDGTPSLLAGPRIARFERVEWHTIPDAATAAAALQTGQMDWWEQPATDLLPLLRRNSAVEVEVLDTSGSYTMVRPNHLQPPFENPAVRRALLGAIRQSDFVQAIAGDDRRLWCDGIGFFSAGAPMANDAGLEALTGPRDLDGAKRALAAAGYRGERIVLLAPTDFVILNALSEVAGDLLRRVGFNLDYQATDWGTVVQRLASQEPVERGGWSVFCNYTTGRATANPAGHNFIRGSGRTAIFGWPDSPRLEELRTAWFEAPDAEAQARIGRDMQLQAFQDVPYYPTGMAYQATAHRRDLVGLLKGMPLFTNVRRA